LTRRANHKVTLSLTFEFMLKRGKMLNLSLEVPTCHWRKTLGAARKVARLGEIAGLKREDSKVCPPHLKVEMQRCQG